MEPILVEVECIQNTAADIDYFEQGREYTIDMRWAKKRDIWQYFRPLREVSAKEAEDRIHDEILPEREKINQERTEANEEAEAKITEKKPEPVKSYPGPESQTSHKDKILGSQIGRKAKK